MAFGTRGVLCVYPERQKEQVDWVTPLKGSRSAAAISSVSTSDPGAEPVGRGGCCVCGFLLLVPRFAVSSIICYCWCVVVLDLCYFFSILVDSWILSCVCGDWWF